MKFSRSGVAAGGAWSPSVTRGVILFACFLLLNAVAYMHAYRMTHFVMAGTRTPRPESLSLPQKVRVLLTGPVLPKPRTMSTPREVGLDYRSKTVTTADDTRLATWWVPCPQPKGTVILFPGYSSGRSSLLPQSRFLHEVGWNVFLVDFRGCGDSDGTVTTLGVREAKDVAAASRWAETELAAKPLVLYGTSMGSAAVLRAVADGLVRPDGLILECPFDRLVTTVGHRFTAMGLPTFPFAHMLVFWGGFQHGFDGFAHNPVDYARSVRSPALVLQGTEDTRVSGQEARAVSESMNGLGTFHLFSGAGHGRFCESAPLEYRSVVGAWLGALATGGSRRGDPPPTDPPG